MGGKFWSVDEERVFWTQIVPVFRRQQLADTSSAKDARGWEALCKVMQTAMGESARRTYTALMLYEHFFQNSVMKRFSPNAGRFVRAYIRRERMSRSMDSHGIQRAVRPARSDTHLFRPYDQVPLRSIVGHQDNPNNARGPATQTQSCDNDNGVNDSSKYYYDATSGHYNASTPPWFGPVPAALLAVPCPLIPAVPFPGTDSASFESNFGIVYGSTQPYNAFAPMQPYQVDGAIGLEKGVQAEPAVEKQYSGTNFRI
ncbi:hypothetical protein SPI_08902 [Niveomyces insectorum RCEF 264]|uniref:Uncharacterized protein n=1 Tax=Niveomyces insectorum RCEF 264 TaxID=1081102 RepID=A0A167MFF0_9HYPO|nr:hypothetical protein SPI_08902 [Niveomyces insectorum RCEF 264]